MARAEQPKRAFASFRQHVLPFATQRLVACSESSTQSPSVGALAKRRGLLKRCSPALFALATICSTNIAGFLLPRATSVSAECAGNKPWHQDAAGQPREAEPMRADLGLGLSLGRRGVLGGVGLGLMAANAPAARAAVGEGDALPEGAKQEDRIRRAMTKWKEWGVNMTSGQIKTEEEWQNTQGLLRRLYGLQDDMSYLSRDFLPDPKKVSEKLITAFKRRVKDADKPAKAKDVEEFMVIHKEVTDFLKDFLVMLENVPDQLDGGSAEDFEASLETVT